MAYNFKSMNRSVIKNLFALLQGNMLPIQESYHNLNRLGAVTGIIVGGNLSILCSLIGSKTLNDLPENIILFI